MNHGSREVRSKELGALTFLHNTSAAEPLLKALRDDNKEVRLSAAEDLGHIGGWNRTAEKTIRAALENVGDDIREEAAHALEKMEKEREHDILYSEIWEA